MKNLPNKIFLAATEEIQNLDNTFVGIAHSNPEDIIEPIEYIKKDAFVKKAADYIAYNMQCTGYTLQTKAEFIRDFKKYMND